ncbi:DUF6138 family protein [Capnocytophaga gingivalis]|uniref:DUF6138 family protein n=1 Tax=Capnocytophaga gingivalis TaxID=1017 RepID=A0ABU5Z831_9FLAO|nr:DUF6138 family protein [Capnocytophaga gingivalis]MEB3074848.1 DUF6138 family protein [Capnocytophaga gingivalis]
MNKETIIKEILTGVTATFDRLDLPKKPYGRNELWEGITDYLKIKQRKDNIEFHNNEEEYTCPSITIKDFEQLPDDFIDNELLPALEEQLTQMFFNPEFYYRFEYKLTLVFDFLSASGHHARKQVRLEHHERKAELKERLDTYVQKVIYEATEKMKEKELHSFFDKLFNFELTGYSEDKVIEILNKGITLIDPKWKKTLKEYQWCLLYHTREWKEKVFMKLYYKGEDDDYSLKKGITPEKVDAHKLNLFVAQALWHIKFKEYSWDVEDACEDLERAAKELGSKKAAMYLKEGTGILPNDLIHYKDSDIECDANDVFAEISVKIKQESAMAYDKALDFIIALLKADFPASYHIKFSSKAPKQFLDIKGIAKSPTHRFFAQALQYEELRPKLVAYAEVAMKEFQWYSDVEEGEKSCMPGSYAVFGLGLIGEEYFPLVSQYFALLDDEHQMIHKYFVSALIDRYGVNEKSLPLICQGITSAQFDMVFKNLEKEMEKPENKELLAKFLKEKEAFFMANKEPGFYKYYEEDIYYAIYGKQWKKKVKN